MRVELEQPEENGWKGWVVLELTDDGEQVSISRDYQRPGEMRRTWRDEGIVLRVQDLPAVVEMLQAVLQSSVAEEKNR